MEPGIRKIFECQAEQAVEAFRGQSLDWQKIRARLLNFAMSDTVINQHREEIEEIFRRYIGTPPASPQRLNSQLDETGFSSGVKDLAIEDKPETMMIWENGKWGGVCCTYSNKEENYIAPSIIIRYRLQSQVEDGTIKLVCRMQEVPKTYNVLFEIQRGVRSDVVLGSKWSYEDEYLAIGGSKPKKRKHPDSETCQPSRALPRPRRGTDETIDEEATFLGQFCARYLHEKDQLSARATSPAFRSPNFRFHVEQGLGRSGNSGVSSRGRYKSFNDLSSSPNDTDDSAIDCRDSRRRTSFYD